ncbi:hypothetical protein GCM10027074_29770 [Streptomyces deserti]
MADEQYRWLDRETAERLLSGEPPEAVDPAARDRAERLAKMLGALSTPPPLTSEELPGEAAALAAFRKARAERGDAELPAGRRSAAQASHAGLVRLGGPAGAARRPRWARPARLGLAAALAVGMVGGVAVAAGTGVLPAPFGGGEPDPAASVSAAVTPPERSLPSPPPSGSPQGESTPGGPSSDPSSGIAGGSGRDGASGGTTPKPGADLGADDPGAHPGDQWKGDKAACRDIRDGKALDPGRKRALEGVAGGPARVWTYCRGVLSATDGGSPKDKDTGKDTGQGTSKGGDKGKGAVSGQGEQGGKDGDDAGDTVPGGHRDGALAPSARPQTLLPKKATTFPDASPSPIYSAL